MDTLFLIPPTLAYAEQIITYQKSFGADYGNIEGSGALNNTATPAEWLANLKKNEDAAQLPPDRVPAFQFIAVKKSTNEIVGLLNLRLTLNDYLENFGGHIGYSIAPNFRRRGYGSEMLRHGLHQAAQLNLARVLITCNDSNLGSAKVIENNGGVLEDKRFDASDNEWVRRYWLVTSAAKND